MILGTDVRNPFSQDYPIELRAEIQKYLTLDERHALRHVSQTVFKNMTDAAQMTENIKSESFKKSEESEYKSLFNFPNYWSLKEIKLINDCRRWFELMILNMPPESKIESLKVTVWKSFDKMNMIKAVLVCMVASFVLGVGIGSAIVFPISLVTLPLLHSAAYGAIALVGLSTGYLILSNIIYREYLDAKKHHRAYLLVQPSAAMQEKKCVYIVSQNDSKYEFSMKTSWREQFGKLQGLPIQESTYLEFKKRFCSLEIGKQRIMR